MDSNPFIQIFKRLHLFPASQYTTLMLILRQWTSWNCQIYFAWSQTQWTINVKHWSETFANVPLMPFCSHYPSRRAPCTELQVTLASGNDIVITSMTIYSPFFASCSTVAHDLRRYQKATRGHMCFYYSKFLPAKPAFLVCDGSTDNNRQQQQHRLVLEMWTFNRLGGGKFSENTTPLSQIDESSKSLR